MKPDQQVDSIRRLRSARGHLGAVIKMVQANKPCVDVLHQIRAVQGALQAARALLITCQARESEAIIREDPDPRRRVAELARLVALFAEVSHYSNHHLEVIPWAKNN